MGIIPEKLHICMKLPDEVYCVEASEIKHAWHYHMKKVDNSKNVKHSYPIDTGICPFCGADLNDPASEIAIIKKTRWEDTNATGYITYKNDDGDIESRFLEDNEVATIWEYLLNKARQHEQSKVAALEDEDAVDM